MITARDLDKKVTLNGVVLKIGKPYIRITYAKYECPSCGTIIGVVQDSKRLREPKKCSCGRIGGFGIIDTETTESQEIVVSEQGTEFLYIVFIEKQKLIRKLTVIQEGCSVKVSGIVKVYFKSKSAVGDLVIFATALNQNRRKR